MRMKNFFKINDYQFEYMKKPIMLLSLISALVYALKLFSVSFADNIFFFSVILIVSIPIMVRIRNVCNKITFTVFLFILFILYINVYEDTIIFLAEKCKNNGIFFGFVNSFFNTIGLADFENLIYHTAYGGAKLIKGVLATGAADIFLLNPQNSGTYIFLCGRYISILTAIGIAFSIKKNRGFVLFVTMFTVLTGNFTPYLLMLLFMSTPDYFLFLLFNFFSYFAANFARIGSGFAVSPSVFEFLVYKNNYVYTLAVGIFLCAVSYYISRLVKERRGWYNNAGEKNERKRRTV